MGTHEYANGLGQNELRASFKSATVYISAHRAWFAHVYWSRISGESSTRRQSDSRGICILHIYILEQCFSQLIAGRSVRGSPGGIPFGDLLSLTLAAAVVCLARARRRDNVAFFSLINVICLSCKKSACSKSLRDPAVSRPRQKNGCYNAWTTRNLLSFHPVFEQLSSHASFPLFTSS